MQVSISYDLEALSRKAAEFFVALSEECIKKKGRFTVALSGGSTPVRLYALLGCAPYKQMISWERVHLFWADERFVPRDHRDSNYRNLNENLLKKIPIPAGNVHPVRTDMPISISVDAYEEEVRAFLRTSQGKSPRFDLIILGIGEDGHTASLFPGSEVLKERERLVASVGDEKHKHPRVTLTTVVINNAANIFFLVSGKEKAPIMKKVIEDRDSSLPASLIEPKGGNLLFLLDEDASRFLTRINHKLKLCH